uniref:FHF complex subunit HOOK-interacting protein C-terminal domain-containing protein n=1 Tax=Meloidogyne enterolobii TaxID=390850 RepID=A0A6V7WD90_MELEN|nr:unnamed protein product [Meloidogyne enterolobii]
MDRNKFINLLNLLPTRSSNNENKLLIEDLSLIDARWQHLEELRIEKLELTQQMSKEPNPFRLNLEGESGGEEVFLNINGGILMKSTEEKGAGILLESLFDILSNLTENSFNTNIQLLGVFNLLFSYPQPLLTAYLFYVDSLRGNLPLLKINDILKQVKNQIDLSVINNKQISQELFEQLLIRIFKNNKLLKNLNSNFQQQNSRERRNKLFFSSTIASLEGQNNFLNLTIKEKNLIYSCIVFIQLCQMLAAFALQHSPPAILIMPSRPA